MLSQNIKELRNKNQWTQKELAEKLHVTSQAISRWEKGEVEPSVSTIGEMARIFNVTTDEIISGQENRQQEKITETEKKDAEQDKPMLAVCEICNRPIYNGDEIVRETTGRKKLICSNCAEKQQAEEFLKTAQYRKSQRKKSFIWATIISMAFLVVGIICSINNKFNAGEICTMCFICIGVFTFVSCLFLKNNFVEELFLSIASWGVVKFPGLIFSFDLDGITWLICMKILFAVLGFLIGLCAILLALLICVPLSIFVYPFALYKNLQTQN